MPKTNLRKLIDAIPGDDGWWHSHNGDTYEELAIKLTESGLTDSAAVELLACAYAAASDEFGN